MLESIFYLSVYLTRRQHTVKKLAPFVTELDSQNFQSEDLVCLVTDTGNVDQGLYYWTGKRWILCVDHRIVAQSIQCDNVVNLYFDVEPFTIEDPSAQVFRNGQLINTLEISSKQGIYTVITPRAVGGATGTVKSVNSIEPSSAGNILLTPEDIGAASIGSDGKLLGSQIPDDILAGTLTELTSAGGISLVNSGITGELKGLSAGTNITLIEQSGSILISSSGSSTFVNQVIQDAGESLVLQDTLGTTRVFDITLTESTCSITLDIEFSLTESRELKLILRQGTGANLVEWNSNIKWQLNQPPALSYDEGTVSIIKLISSPTILGNWYGILEGAWFE